MAVKKTRKLYGLVIYSFLNERAITAFNPRTYTQIHTLTVVQGGRVSWLNPSSEFLIWCSISKWFCRQWKAKRWDCYKTDSWQKNTSLERMEHKNQTDCILKKVFPFLFRVPLRYLPSSEVFLYHLLNCQIAKGPSSQVGSIKAVVCNPTHTAATHFTKSSCPSTTPNPQLICVKFPHRVTYLLTKKC